MTDRIATLRAELRDDTAYVATAEPRLTWTVAADDPGWEQASAELTDGATTVPLGGRESVLVAWPFAPLAAGDRREVRVRATAADGRVTDWSDPLVVAAGFLGEGEWVAQPVGLGDAEREAQPALVRTVFTLGRPVARVELFWTALGVAEPELNGEPVSDDVLSPGWTAYRDRLVHETVDVTALVREGRNVLGATIAGAWYTEKYGFFTFTNRLYGTQPSFLAQLRVTYADGTVETVAATGEGWQARGDGPVVDSGIYPGEHQDLRRIVDLGDADAAGWSPARVGAAANPGYEHVPVPEARIAPPVRRTQTLPVAAVLDTPSGGRILDFGQNLVGRLRIRARGAEGDRVVVRHAEVLEDGELALRPLRNAAATATFDLAGPAPEDGSRRFVSPSARSTTDGTPRSLSEKRSDETKRGDAPEDGSRRFVSPSARSTTEDDTSRSLSEERSDETKRGNGPEDGSRRFVSPSARSTTDGTPRSLSEKRSDETKRGDGSEILESRFSFYGFRYAEITGLDIDPADVEAVVLHTDMTRTGWFEASDPLLERLHENVVWGMRGNFLSIPTDCPQRDERLGWTGDIQVFSPTASFLYDCDAFLTSWLRDLAHEQARQDGDVTLVVPAALPSFGPLGATAAWGDAATVVPSVLHDRFGDRGVVAAQYPSMTAWVDRVLSEAGDSGLWAGRMQLGDWLDPSAPPDKPQQARVDSDIVATAYLARSLRLVADAAALLGEPADAERYAALAERSRAAFEREYVTPSGRMMSDAPTAYALALEFDLVTDPGTRQALSDRLAELVREGGYRIGTGFVGTPLVTDALTGGGHVAVAERLLLQTEAPSWLYPVTMGATTVWERWDSLLPDGSVNPGEMTSFNHYALGAVADWLHRTVAGLAPDAPGYARLRIAPRPLRALTSASARHRTPYGEAAVSWERDGDDILVRAVVPANTTAIVALPGLDEVEVTAGTHEWILESEPDEPRPPLDGTAAMLADVIDDPRAYRALVDAVARFDPDRAAALISGTMWGARRGVSTALMFLPPHVVADVDEAIRLATATGAAGSDESAPAESVDPAASDPQTQES